MGGPVAPAMLFGGGVHDYSSAYCDLRRVTADYEVVPRQGCHRLLEPELHQPAAARFDGRRPASFLRRICVMGRGLDGPTVFKQDYAGQDFGGAVMESHARAMNQWPGRTRQEVEPRVQHSRGPQPASRCKDCSTAGLIDVQALKIDRGSLPGKSLVSVMAVDLQVSNSGSESR